MGLVQLHAKCLGRNMMGILLCARTCVKMLYFSFSFWPASLMKQVVNIISAGIITEQAANLEKACQPSTSAR